MWALAASASRLDRVVVMSCRGANALQRHVNACLDRAAAGDEPPAPRAPRVPPDLPPADRPDPRADRRRVERRALQARLDALRPGYDQSTAVRKGFAKAVLDNTAGQLWLEVRAGAARVVGVPHPPTLKSDLRGDRAVRWSKHGVS